MDKGPWITLSVTDDRVVQIRNSGDGWINVRTVKLAQENGQVKANMIGFTHEEFASLQQWKGG